MENKDNEITNNPKPRTFLKGLGKKRIIAKDSPEKDITSPNSSKRKRAHSQVLSSLLSNLAEAKTNSGGTPANEGENSKSTITPKARLQRRISDTGIPLKKTTTFILPTDEMDPTATLGRPRLRRQSTKAHLSEDGKEQVRLHAEEILKREKANHSNNHLPADENNNNQEEGGHEARTISLFLLPECDIPEKAVSFMDHRKEDQSQSQSQSRGDLKRGSDGDAPVNVKVMSDSDGVVGENKKFLNKNEEEGENFTKRSKVYKTKPTDSVSPPPNKEDREGIFNSSQNNQTNPTRDIPIRRSISLEHLNEKQHLKSSMKERHSVYKKDTLKFIISDEVKPENALDPRGRPKLKRQNTKPKLREEDKERIMAHAEHVLRRENTEMNKSPSDMAIYRHNDSNSPSDSRINNNNDLFPKVSKAWKKSPSSLSPYPGHQYATISKSTRAKSTNDKPVMQKVKTEHMDRKSNFLIRPNRRVTSPRQSSGKSADDGYIKKSKISPRKSEPDSLKFLHSFQFQRQPDHSPQPSPDVYSGQTSPVTPRNKTKKDKSGGGEGDFNHVSLEISVKERISFIEKAELAFQRKSDKGSKGDKILKQKSEKIMIKPDKSDRREIKISGHKRDLKPDAKQRLRMTSPRPSQRQLYDTETPADDTDTNKKKVRRSISFENLEILPISIGTPTGGGTPTIGTPVDSSKVVPRARQSRKKKLKNKVTDEDRTKEQNSGQSVTDGKEDSQKKNIELELIVTSDENDLLQNLSNYDSKTSEKVTKFKKCKPTQDSELPNEGSDPHIVKIKKERKSSMSRHKKEEGTSIGGTTSPPAIQSPIMSPKLSKKEN